MSQTATTLPELVTVADLLEHLGDIPPERIRWRPRPGTATERDVIAIHGRENRLFELVEGTLVEKAMGFFESRMAVVLIRILEAFCEKHDLGIVLAPDGMMRLAPGLVRMPDVSFISWDRLPRRRIPRKPIPDLAPDLAIEVLSVSNTKREMERKCREYFAAGVRLVWYLDPAARTMQVFTAPDEVRVIKQGGTIDGGDVLPGFKLRLKELFERAERGRKK